MKNIREEIEMQDRKWWDTIVDAMAKALFVSAYSYMIDRYCEDSDCSYNDLPDNIPYAGAQEDWMDNSPPVSDEAKEEAYNIARQYETFNKKSLDALLEDAAEADGISVDNIDSDYASDFGHYLGMMALGHGVSWFDDHEKFPLKPVHAEFYVWPEEFGLDTEDEDDLPIQEESKQYLTEGSSYTDQTRRVLKQCQRMIEHLYSVEIHDALRERAEKIVIELLRDGLKIKWINLGNMGGYDIYLVNGEYPYMFGYGDSKTIDLVGSLNETLDYEDRENEDGEITAVEMFPMLRELQEIAEFVQDERNISIGSFDKDDIRTLKRKAGIE